jgi:hypothetical protein
VLAAGLVSTDGTHVLGIGKRVARWIVSTLHMYITNHSGESRMGKKNIYFYQYKTAQN